MFIISMGLSAFGRNADILNSKYHLPLNKLLYNQCVFPVTTEGAETWAHRVERKLRSHQRVIERRMLGVTHRDGKTAAWFGEQTRVEDILIQIK